MVILRRSSCKSQGRGPPGTGLGAPGWMLHLVRSARRRPSYHGCPCSSSIVAFCKTPVTIYGDAHVSNDDVYIIYTYIHTYIYVYPVLFVLPELLYGDA